MKPKHIRKPFLFNPLTVTLTVCLMGSASPLLSAAEQVVDSATANVNVSAGDTVWFDSTNTNAAIPLTTVNGAPIATGFLAGWAHTANSFLKYDGANVIEIPLAEKVVGAANLGTATGTSCYYDNLAATTVAANQSIGLVETTRDLLLSNGATLDIAMGGLMFHTSGSHWVKVGSGSGNITSSSGKLNIAVHNTGGDNAVETVVIKNFNSGTPLSLTKSGKGQIFLNGSNTYSGGTFVNNGKLRARSNSAFGASGSTVTVTGLNSQASLASGGTYAYNFSLQGLGWQEGTVQRGALRFEGTSTVNGNVTLTGDSRIVANGNTTGTITGTVSGSSALSIGLQSDTFANSGGTVTFNGSGAGLTGLVSVYSGRLNLNTSTGGNVAVFGGAGIGGEGTIAGNLEIGDGTPSKLVVNGSTAGALAVTGTADISFGATDIEATAFPAAPATSFTAFTYGTLVGDASTLTASTMRGGSVADDPANQRVVVSYTPGTLNWTGTTNANWTNNADLNFDNGSPTRFYLGDHVNFTEAAAVKTLSIVGTVAPSSITFNHTSDYTVNGTGTGITGSTGITKTGSGTLILAGEASSFTGPISIQQGRIKMNMFQSLGNSIGVTIASGAQLDFNGMRPNVVGRSYDFAVAGAGPDGNGAITNTSGTFLYEGAGVRSLTLTGNTSIGGNAGRFDLGVSPFTGTLTGNGHTLTKVGSNTVNFRLDASGSPINFVIAGGRAFAENTNNAFGGASSSVRVKSGARVGTWATRTIPTPVVLEAGGMIYNEGGGTGTWSGTVTLEGDASIESNSALNVTGVISGAFSLTKTGSQQTHLTQPQYGGNTTVNAGVLSLGAATLADSSTVTIGTTAGTKLHLAHTSDDTVAALVFGTTPQAPGRYGSTASTADIKDDTRFSGTGVLNVVPANAYASWETSNGIAGAGATADSDGDGLDNAIEFVVGGDPSGPGSNSSALLPTIGGDATYFELSFRRTDASVSYDPFVEYSSTLSAWSSAESGVNGVLVVVENDHYGPGVDRVTVKIPRSLANGGKLFARLSVQIP